MSDLAGIIKKLRNDARVLVVGDLMVDRYVRGEVTRISPEAPVPVLRKTEVARCDLGGAANAAAQLKRLGAHVDLVGVVGADEAGDELVSMLRALEIPATSIYSDPSRKTTVKTRYLAGDQHLFRLDSESDTPITGGALAFVQSEIRSIARSNDPVVSVISDYGKGVVTDAVARAVLRQASPVVVDPYGTDWSKYANALFIFPNQAELEAALGIRMSDTEFKTKLSDLIFGLEASAIVAKCGASGMQIMSRPEFILVPGHFVPVYDTIGAGDAALAAWVMGMAGNLRLATCGRLANLAGAVVVQQAGVGCLSRRMMINQDLYGSLCGPRIAASASDVIFNAKKARNCGKRVVLATGCFDILHQGHIEFLRQASLAGDYLVVGVNDDDSVRNLKGKGRPLQSSTARAAVIEALRFVDTVVIFNDKLKLVELLRPNVLAEGCDYEEDEIIGAGFVKSHGGEVFRIPLVEGFSSTSVINAGRKRAANA